MITIDPGFNTAIAFWENKELKEVVLIKADKKRDVDKMLKEFRKIDFTGYTMCFIEGVQEYGFGISLTAAVRGDLNKLSMLIGRYTEYLSSIGLQVKILLPRQWKGQLPKQAVAERVKKIIGRTFKTHHEYDAVGIGLAVQGLIDHRIKFI